MLKKMLLVLGIFVGVLVLILALMVIYLFPSEGKILNFLKNNPDKSSIMLVRNDTVLVGINKDKVMPLASTVKIIIAIEYAAQSAEGNVNPDEYVLLSDLDKFYVPNTDGGAHSSWLESVKGKIVDNKISIREIAKGMIEFSSNANTEWLLNKLQLRNVNARIDSLGLKNHTKIYNIVSALFVSKELFPGIKGEELETKLKGVSMDTYIEATNRIHDKLLEDTLYKNEIGELGMDIQRIWSDRLPSSTVEDYVSVMKKINRRIYFDEKTQYYLDEVMEYLMENPANKEWLEHSGMKGGSTSFVLTKALYATDKKGNKTELAYFLNDLSILEMIRLQMSMNAFELNLLREEEFRNEMKAELVK